MNLICPRCLESKSLENILKDSTCTTCGENYKGPGKSIIIWKESAYSIIRNNESLLVKRTRDGKHKKTWARDFIKKCCRIKDSVSVKNFEQLSKLAKKRAIILVVGGSSIGEGAEKIYQLKAEKDCILYSIDIIDTEMVDCIADAHNIPLTTSSVDIVVLQAVLEHVIDPARVIAEVKRVLRDDGLIYSETPFLQPVHEGAYDFQRYTRSGHRYLLRNFDELASGRTGGPTEALLYIVSITINKMVGIKIGSLMWWMMIKLCKKVDNVLFSNVKYEDCSTGFYFIGRNNGRILTTDAIVKYYR